MNSLENNTIRQLQTSNIEALASFHLNKNREYTQFKRGKLQTRNNEITLQNAQIMRESIDVGCRIEASPAECFVPFAAVLPSASPYSFCGQSSTGSPFIQASGGDWELFFEHKIDYVATVFMRDFFNDSYQTLTGKEPDKSILVSQLTPIPQDIQRHYSHQVLDIMNQLLAQPTLLQDESIQRLMCAQLVKLTIDVINPSLLISPPITQHSKRNKGVILAIDYIKANAHLLPDITQLCAISQLSERSLQYGFKEKFGITPVQYLRIFRLNMAHKELISASKKHTTVANIALNWGFVELGRFSRDYKTLFNELPSQTLIKH